jgi:hypothetical protein
MKGTKFGPMVMPKDPDSSNLVWLLDWRASPDLRMPHGTKKLSTCDRDAIKRWIREGALNNYTSVSMVRIISGGLGEFVGPGVDNRVSIDVLDPTHDAFFEFVF